MFAFAAAVRAILITISPDVLVTLDDQLDNGNPENHILCARNRRRRPALWITVRDICGLGQNQSIMKQISH